MVLPLQVSGTNMVKRYKGVSDYEEICGTFSSEPGIGGLWKGTDYVKSMELDEKNITVETDDIEDVEVRVEIVGNASREVTAVSSDPSLVSVEAWEDDEEPGLSYVDLETFEGTGEAEVTITSVGKDKNDREITEKVKVTVVDTPIEDDGDEAE